jgi:hypothetical protein
MNDVERARSKIAEALESALGGKVSFIDAARTVAPLVESAGFDRLAEPFVTFVAIDSETDDLPVARVRELWQPDSVAKQLPDWDRAEAWAKQIGETACRDALALLRAA